MSNIHDVLAAERKLKELIKALAKARSGDLTELSAQCRTASEEYAKAVRELETRASNAEAILADSTEQPSTIRLR